MSDADFEHDRALLGTFPDSPIPLIQLDESSGAESMRMILNPEAVNILSRLRGKVCPVAVAGNSF
jgi:hypothetical protein